MNSILEKTCRNPKGQVFEWQRHGLHPSVSQDKGCVHARATAMHCSHLAGEAGLCHPPTCTCPGQALSGLSWRWSSWFHSEQQQFPDIPATRGTMRSSGPETERASQDVCLNQDQALGKSGLTYATGHLKRETWQTERSLVSTAPARTDTLTKHIHTLFTQTEATDFVKVCVCVYVCVVHVCMCTCVCHPTGLHGTQWNECAVTYRTSHSLQECCAIITQQ